MRFIVNDLKIIINNSVLCKINTSVKKSDFEIGGILLGKISKKNKVIEVDEVYEIESCSWSRSMYKRHAKIAQNIINHRWYETNGLINYVGEWHTHPNMCAIPSYQDVHSIKRIMEDIENIFPAIIMIIAGENMEMSLMAQNEKKSQLLTFNYKQKERI